MFNARNMRVLLVVSVALFLLFSSVNMVPARSFLEDIVNHSKRQKEQCPFFGPICFSNEDCILYEDYNCNGKLTVVFYINFESRVFSITIGNMK